MYTEDEAKKMWCCDGRINGAQEFCDGSSCMAWRWCDKSVEGEGRQGKSKIYGYCGLAGKP